MNRRATLRLRFNGKAPLNTLHALAHTDEPDSVTLSGGVRVKANTLVTDRQINLVRSGPQRHFEMSHPAVFDRILQAFL